MRNKIFMIASFLAAIFVLGSCLKDDVGPDWTSSLKGKMYAEVWNAGFLTIGLSPIPDTVTFKFLVNIASDQPPTQDITVTLAADTSAMGRYNRLKKTNYQLFPYIKIMDPSLTIKAGTRNGYVHVKIWHADLLNACDNFMAPIVIKTASGGVIPTDPLNQGGRLMGLPITNPYAGSYHVTGTFTHPTAGARAIDRNKTFSTVTCKSVQTEVGDTGVNGLVLTINADNSVDISGSYSSTQPCVAVTGQPNVYNPATRTFTLNYYYSGTGGNRVITETAVRL
jgi:hypothetical protein